MINRMGWATRALGGFWLLDGLLQLQPSMWTQRFVNGVLKVAAAGQPIPIHGLLDWGIQLWSRMPGAADLSAALLQIAIGVLLWWPDSRWRRRGLYLSIGWGLVVWFLGEGLGGLLVSGSSIVTGLPGSALIYVGLSVVLLTESRRRREQQMRWGIAGFWFLGALFQARPEFFKPGVLRAQLVMTASTPSPSFLTDPIRIVAGWSGSHAILSNALLLIILLGLTVWTLRTGPRDGRWLAASLATLFAFWWLGMDFGVLGAVGTDPNTAPLIALAALTRYANGNVLGWRRQVGVPQVSRRSDVVRPRAQSMR